MPLIQKYKRKSARVCAVSVTSHGLLLVVDLETLPLSFKDSLRIALKILSRNTPPFKLAYTSTPLYISSSFVGKSRSRVSPFFWISRFFIDFNTVSTRFGCLYLHFRFRFVGGRLRFQWFCYRLEKFECNLIRFFSLRIFSCGGAC